MVDNMPFIALAFLGYDDLKLVGDDERWLAVARAVALAVVALTVVGAAYPLVYSSWSSPTLWRLAFATGVWSGVYSLFVPIAAYFFLGQKRAKTRVPSDIRRTRRIVTLSEACRCAMCEGKGTCLWCSGTGTANGHLCHMCKGHGRCISCNRDG